MLRYLDERTSSTSISTTIVIRGNRSLSGVINGMRKTSRKQLAECNSSKLKGGKLAEN